MSNKIANVAKAVMNLKPFASGLASGFGVNKLFSKGIAKKVVGKSGLGTGMKWRQRAKQEHIIRGDDVYAAQKELERGVKKVYEKGELPGFYYEGGVGPATVKFPNRLKGGVVNVSKKDKALYYAGKYGPTSLAVKAPVAVAAGVALAPKSQKKPAQLPDNLDSWKSLDKSASETYINSKENIMINNPNFQIAFSDQLHKIATSESHPEAVEFLKESSAFTGVASKAWRSIKRFAKNPILKTKEKGYQAAEGLATLRAKHAPTQVGRLKGRANIKIHAEGAAQTRGKITQKRNLKIQEVAEQAGGRSGQQALDHEKWMRDSKHKYSPSVVARNRQDQWVRNKNLRAQKRIKDKNVAQAKLDEKNLEIANIQAGIDKEKNRSILTRIGGGITSKGAPTGVKTTAGAAALAVGGAGAYNITMAEKKKKDNSIFKFGGKKVSE